MRKMVGDCMDAYGEECNRQIRKYYKQYDDHERRTLELLVRRRGWFVSSRKGK